MQTPVCPLGIFVVGTGSGVGKTVVAAGLARLLRRAGSRVAVFKPFTTGDASAEDAQVLARAAGLAGPGPLQPALLDVISPHRSAHAVAPGLAARRDGRVIDLAGVVDDARALGSMADVLVVEGTGGLMAPLSHTLERGGLQVDLVRMLGLPVFLVGNTAPDTVSHLALCAAALRAAEIGIAGIILDQVDPGHDLPDADLLLAIEHAAALRPVSVIPYVGGSEAIRVGSATRRLDQDRAWDNVAT